MRAINYKRHFQLLILAVAALYLSGPIFDRYIPAGDARFYSYFALIGALHATCLIVSLEHAASAVLKVAFVALAAVLSVLTIILMFAMPAPWDGLRFFLVLTLGSALGASAYWLVVRQCWLRSLRFRDFIRTITLCPAATLAAWCVMGLVAWVATMFTPSGLAPDSPISDVNGLMPTIAWWLAFSGSIFWSEARRHATSNAVKPGLVG